MSLTNEQLAARKVGGSDVATILDLNPYKTPEELRLEILGRLVRENGNDSTEAGEIFEEPIRQLYMKRTGRTVHRSHQTLIHPKYDWITAHIDGRIVGEKRGLECKNIHWRIAHLWGNHGGDGIAEYYLPQLMHYLLVMDYELWDCAAYFGGPDLRIYTVERDREWDEIIIERTHNFWYRNVLQDIPCEIDSTRPDALRALKRIYPGTNGTTIPCDEQLLHWVRVMEESRDLATGYDKTTDSAKAHILQAMGNAAILQLGNGTQYTRKEVTRKGFVVEPTTYIDFRRHIPKAAKSE